MQRTDMKAGAMSISWGDLQPVGNGPRDGRCAAPFEPKQHVVQTLSVLRQFIQPAMPVLGVLIGAGAAKSGQGGWAAGMILISISTHFGVAATAMLTRNLGAWVARMQRYGEAGASR
jgi:hypothetical protein